MSPEDVTMSDRGDYPLPFDTERHQSLRRIDMYGAGDVAALVVAQFNVVAREAAAPLQATVARLRGVMVYLCQEGCTMSGSCSEEFGDDEDSWCEVCIMRAALSDTADSERWLEGVKAEAIRDAFEADREHTEADIRAEVAKRVKEISDNARLAERKRLWDILLLPEFTRHQDVALAIIKRLHESDSPQDPDQLRGFEIEPHLLSSDANEREGRAL